MAKLALIGGAHIHTPAFVKTMAETDGIETAYVWDPSSETAEARQKVCGGKIVDSYQAALADDVDAVVICSQTNMHEELVLAAAAAGKHMFVEKPLGMGAADSKKMADAIEKAGVIFQTGYFMRGGAEVQAVRNAIKAGHFGTVTRIRMSNCHSGALGGWFDTEWRWMADPKIAGCGAFGDLGTHVLDLILWMTEDDTVDAATGHVHNFTNRYEGCDETGEGMLRYESGLTATFAGAWLDVTNPNFLEVSGTKGHARITANKLYLQSELVAGADGKEPVTDLPEARPHAFALFLSAVLGEADVPLVSVKEAALRSIVMEAVYEGATTDRWVKPKL